LNTKIHAIVANETTPIVFQRSPGQVADVPEGRKWIPQWSECYRDQDLPLLMDKAYEGDAVRTLAEEHGLQPVVPPKSNRVELGNRTWNCTNAATKWSVFSAV
jgi:hypothetical protein